MILPNKASKDKDKNMSSMDKEEGLGKFGSQNIDIAMVVSKLSKFLNEQVWFFCLKDGGSKIVCYQGQTYVSIF